MDNPRDDLEIGATKSLFTVHTYSTRTCAVWNGEGRSFPPAWPSSTQAESNCFGEAVKWTVWLPGMIPCLDYRSGKCPFSGGVSQHVSSSIQTAKEGTFAWFVDLHGTGKLMKGEQVVDLHHYKHPPVWTSGLGITALSISGLICQNTMLKQTSLILPWLWSLQKRNLHQDYKWEPFTVR